MAFLHSKIAEDHADFSDVDESLRTTKWSLEISSSAVLAYSRVSDNHTDKFIKF